MLPLMTSAANSIRRSLMDQLGAVAFVGGRSNSRKASREQKVAVVSRLIFFLLDSSRDKSGVNRSCSLLTGNWQEVQYGMYP